MQMILGRCSIVIAMALLVAGCNKKAEAGADSTGASTTTAAATGIKGKIKGKPFAGKVARVLQDSHGPSLYIAASDSTCDKIGFNPPKGENRASVTAPLKKGTAKLDGDKVYADLSMWDDKGQLSSNSTKLQGEIEWITVPTDKTKGLVRVSVTHEALDTKLEGSMEADLCPKQ